MLLGQSLSHPLAVWEPGRRGHCTCSRGATVAGRAAAGARNAAATLCSHCHSASNLSSREGPTPPTASEGSPKACEAWFGPAPQHSAAQRSATVPARHSPAALALAGDVEVAAGVTLALLAAGLHAADAAHLRQHTPLSIGIVLDDAAVACGEGQAGIAAWLIAAGRWRGRAAMQPVK